MASFTKSPPSPQCLSHLRRLVRTPSLLPSSPFHQQIRGKKKSTKGPHPVNVRLLEDIRGYGRKGSIIPIAPGRMRNIYFPQRKAEYVTAAQIRAMGGPKELNIERDFGFGIETPAQQQEQPGDDSVTPETVNVRVDLLTPQRTSEIIETLIPPELIFHRVPITTPEPTSSPEPPGQSITAEALAQPMPAPITRIFGSVSTADMVDAIKAVLAEDEEGARVVLSAEDVYIDAEASEETGVEADRLKALGEYRVEIRPKGMVDAIRRGVSIRAVETDA
ncbi:MAG: hypothetical protein LQ345_001421 [Seirophora villosa]|nr:MAG: hypothetical protein LQ345_001421 [Seirophora villosa]